MVIAPCHHLVTNCNYNNMAKEGGMVIAPCHHLLTNCNYNNMAKEANTDAMKK